MPCHFFLNITSIQNQLIASKVLTQNEADQFDRNNPKGFYQSARKIRDQYQNENVTQTVADQKLMTDSLNQILHQLPKHLVVTLPMVTSSINLAPLSGSNQTPVIFSIIWYGLGLILLIFQWLKSLKKANTALAFFLLPPLYNFAFMAFLTHNIPRYNFILIPFIPLVYLVTLHQIHQKYA